MKYNYTLPWQLSDIYSREHVDLTLHAKKIEAQRKQFNYDSKAGIITKITVTSSTITPTYSSNSELVNPGAALHGYSQGLVENYTEFEDMLSDGKQKRLFEYK